jgi:hypothetical protein
LITVQEFYDSLLETLKSTAGVDGSSIETEFLRYALDELVEYGDIETYDLIEDGRDAGDRWRIDAFSLDNETDISIGTASIFVSLFDQSEEPSNLIQTDIDRLLKKLKNYVEFCLEKDIYTFFEPGSGPFQTALQIRSLWHNSSAPKIKLYVVSNRPVSKRITELENVEIQGASAEVLVWDLNRFFQVKLRGVREALEIDLKDSPINCLMATSSDEGLTKSYLAVMPAATLVKIYGKWGGRLLEQNVRSFLSVRKPANKGMRETIKETPDKFFAFNNGITATAEEAEFIIKDNGLYITHLKNLQIVNGGQTTALIFSAATKDKYDVSKIFVQMKLTIISPEEANKLVPFISRYANTQTKVNNADFFSNHAFHRRIEDFSRRIIAPPRPGSLSGSYWYYERASGQYLNDQAYKTESERKKFQALHPSDQVISKTDFAKFINTFESLPHVVSKGAQFNFLSFAKIVEELWDKSDANFNEGYFRASIAKAIIFKRMERLVQAQKSTWYNGHRANIVTYTLSLIAKAVKESKKEFNYELIWKNQAIPASIEQYLISIAKQVNDLLKDESRLVGNVDSYAKTEGFWGIAQSSCEIDLGEIDAVLIDLTEAKEREKEEKGKQKLTTSLEDEIKVKSVKPDVWSKIQKYLEDNNQENPSKLALLSKAKISAHKLTEKECQFLFLILDEYESHYRNED